MDNKQEKEQLFRLNITDSITILAHSLQFIRNSVLKTWVIALGTLRNYGLKEEKP